MADGSHFGFWQKAATESEDIGNLNCLENFRIKTAGVQYRAAAYRLVNVYLVEVEKKIKNTARQSINN